MVIKEDSYGAIVLHAPSVHSGGGVVLLKNFLSVPDLNVRWAQLDERTKNAIQLPEKVLIQLMNL